MKAQSGVEVQLYSFFNLGARCGWVVNAKPRPLYLRDTDLERIAQRLGGLPGRSGRVAENLAPTGIRSQDPPARSE